MQGQRRNTLLPSELETSEHNRKTKQDWCPAAMTTDVLHAHIDQICMHQQLSRNWQLAAQIGRDDERSSDTGLASVVSRWLGRSVGAWDPA